MGETKRKPSTEKLYEDIKSEYRKLKDKKSDGVPIYNEAFIVKELSKKFYKSTSTICNILYNRV